MNLIIKTCLNIRKYQPCSNGLLKDVVKFTNQNGNIVRNITCMSFAHHQPTQHIQIERKYFSTLQNGFQDKVACIDQKGVSDQLKLRFVEREQFKVSHSNCHRKILTREL
jgi:hypothetical protein